MESEKSVQRTDITDIKCPGHNHRTSFSTEAIKKSFEENLFYVIGKPPVVATKQDFYTALAHTIRDRLLERWTASIATYVKEEVRMVSYMSAEFLLGPHLGNNIVNLGIYENVKKAMEDMGLDLKELLDVEVEPGLGNGGLGRLAACYMDSMATLGIPAIGYGIRYEHGMFEQRIKDGWQVERADNWLHFVNPWELCRQEMTYDVQFGGYTQGYTAENGVYKVKWIPEMVIKGVAYDTPILGYDTNNCTLLRLWKSEAGRDFDFQEFNMGDYYGAVEEKVAAENLSKVLYPNDEQMAGKKLRLQQQYFLVSCSLQNLLYAQGVLQDADLSAFDRFSTIQLNDTHPALAIPEFMRLLIDEHGFSWDDAWDITRNTFNYTNHTLLPEALEKWPLPLFQSILPRHLEIIYEINRRFLKEVRIDHPFDNDFLARTSIIDEAGDKYVRMANLACIGSRKINGVAALHTELLKKYVLKDFHDLWPQKIVNVTNGVTPRRWLALSNPGLSALITEAIGTGWLKDLQELKGLEKFASDAAFQEKWRRVKEERKEDAAVYGTGDISINTKSIFDVQVKRIHEYKRQHLNLLHIVTLYLRLKDNPGLDMPPRTFVFGGKAAPGYFMAKLIIKFINSVADIINSDKSIDDRLKVVFIPNYNVKTGHIVYPMANLSEQISLAGKEASGTGNMKFSMNGALTIGTLDGANIEIREEVGEENFFLFGMTADEVYNRKMSGYRPMDYLEANEELKRVIRVIESGLFSEGDTELFRPLIDSLKYNDEYMVFADYASYVETQAQVSRAFMDQKEWTRKSILNVARIGKFSSDRSIKDYCEKIWKVSPVEVSLDNL